MWYNGLVIFLLRTPLHVLLSQSMMLITYTGRKSGKQYCIPVNYLPIDEEQGRVFLTTSLRKRTWWRNLRGSAPVSLRIQGKNYPATAQAVEDEADVVANLAVFLSHVPNFARYIDIKLTPDGVPDPQDLRQAAQKRVMVRSMIGE
jgi:deazaflavin-dependent oxidoreductase (nitroreductase family)